jgi:membrane-associated phospholipid phosphatase
VSGNAPPPTPNEGLPGIERRLALLRQRFSRRSLLRGTLAGGTAIAGAGFFPAPLITQAQAATHEGGPTVVVQWNNMTLQAIRDLHPGPPMAARALAIVHTCMYDAWTAYHPVALPTQPSGVSKVHGSHSHADKTQAVSYAAYRALLNLFPADAALFTHLMVGLGFDPQDATTDTSTPAGIGNVCSRAVLTFRHHDGSNQANGYADYTGYPAAYGDYPAAPEPINTPDAINDPNHWQPLRVANGQGGFVVQTYLGPHWGFVVPFGLTAGRQFRPSPGPATIADPAYVAQAQQILGYSAALTDTQKVIAEYWKDGPRSETPPGHWCLFGQFVSARDQHGLDDDIVFFFALANAVFDAGIAAWDAKRFYISVRPVTAIHYLYVGQPVMAWAGPCLDTQQILGQTWMPYQPSTIVTPPFPEYPSGHSTFSAAAAEILRRFTDSDTFGFAFTLPANSSAIEPSCTPASDVILSWLTFSAAADQAGVSRRYGGIHFQQGDLDGRRLGRQVGFQVWTKAMAYLNGTA